MDENFIILKLSKLKSRKNNKEYFVIVIYSLKYEFDYKVFITKELYDYLQNNDFRTVNINNFIMKFYDKQTNKFNYSINCKELLDKVTSVKNTSNK